jgi:GT2 family glycosyltransferase
MEKVQGEAERTFQRSQLLRISIIIPNYNGFNILKNCLDSLEQHDRRPDQIIVVDNGSTDGSPDSIRKNYPWVTLVALNRNTGFTGANNAGLSASDGDLLVLLNNDCVAEPGWLAALEDRMNDHSVGAVTSSMRNINDIRIMDSAGGEIDWMGFSRDIGKGQSASIHDRPLELAFPCGGAVMIRRSALPDASRLFWDHLFIYQEDLDLGFELFRTGWKVVYEPSAVVRHMHSATTGRGSFFKEYLCIRNRLLVLKKHFSADTFSRLTPVIREWQGLWAVACMARGRAKLARAVLKGTWDGMRTDVTPFDSAITLNLLFETHAVRCDPCGGIKSRLYDRAEEIIRKGQ